MYYCILSNRFPFFPSVACRYVLFLPLQAFLLLPCLPTVSPFLISSRAHLLPPPPHCHCLLALVLSLPYSPLIPSLPSILLSFSCSCSCSCSLASSCPSFCPLPHLPSQAEENKQLLFFLSRSSVFRPSSSFTSALALRHPLDSATLV